MPDFRATCAAWGPSFARAIRELGRLFPFAAASYLERSELEVRVDSRQQRIGEPRRTAGVVLRVWDGAEFREEAVDAGAGPGGLAEAVRRLADHSAASGAAGMARRGGLLPGSNRAGRSGWRSFGAAGAEVEFNPDALVVRRTPTGIDPLAVPLPEKLARCRTLQRQLAASSSLIANAAAAYSEIVERTFILTTEGRQVAQEILRVRMVGAAYAQKDGVTQFEFRSKGGTGGLEVAELGPEDAATIGETAVRLLQAAKVEPGYYDCICSPEVAGTIAHEAFGHGVEADMFLKGRARSQRYLGRPVGSEMVDLIDDPSYPGAYGSYFFDDEGVEASPTYILRRGVFERPLTDQNAAWCLGLAPTANGRRQDYERKVYPRMSNTFFGPGQDRLEDMLASIDHGILLVRGHSGMEDPKDWGIQVIVHYGREIRHGQLTDRYFSPIGVTGYVPDLLASVSMASGHVETDTGFCGKGHKEWVPVSTGGPYVKLRARLG
ncbi:MAG: TldD/PmbA family protein [Firmicutes bacterium]|nr:TldD/PmbA family protein [Bacillota bacterium]